jgi:hypothetical protein
MIMTTMTDKTFDVCSVCIAWEFAMLLDSPGDQIGVNDRVFIVRSFLGPWRHFLEQLIVEAQPDAACVEGAPLADIQKSRMLEEVKLSHTKHRVIFDLLHTAKKWMVDDQLRRLQHSKGNSDRERENEELEPDIALKGFSVSR